MMKINDNNLEQCTKCTICTVHCPVVEVDEHYPGPKHAGPDGERLRLRDAGYFEKTLKMCLNCKRCEVACPSDVRIGDIIQKARLKHIRTTPKLRDVMLSNTDVMGTISSTFAPLVNVSLGLKPVKFLLEKVMQIDRHRKFPEYSPLTFKRWYNKEAAQKQRRYDKQVAYFHGCYVNYNFPLMGQQLVKIMNAAGYGVQIMQKEKCCGVALIANGLEKQAQKQAKHNVKQIRKAIKQSQIPLIGTSSTCIFTLKDEYPHVLGVDNDDINKHISLATKFLYTLLEEGKIKLIFKRNYHKKIYYHTACHMEKLGWGIYSTSLLKMIPGVELRAPIQNCCGIAGTYGFKKENYANSQAIGKKVFDQIEEYDPDCVATDCETCKWQIEMSTGHLVWHPISILADAIDYDETIKANACGFLVV